MSSSQPGPRPQGPFGRGPPSGSSAGPSVRPPPITVNGGAQVPGETMSRAEKFEDEKRRIIESCFGKKEPDGSGTAPKQFEGFGPRLTVMFNSVGILHNTHTDPRRCGLPFESSTTRIPTCEQEASYNSHCCTEVWSCTDAQGSRK